MCGESAQRSAETDEHSEQQVYVPEGGYEKTADQTDPHQYRPPGDNSPGAEFVQQVARKGTQQGVEAHHQGECTPKGAPRPSELRDDRHLENGEREASG